MKYFVDTNYFLRLLIGEKTEQFQEVYALFSQAAEGTIQLITSLVVFFEIYGVLSSFYQKDKSSCIMALEKILAMEFVEIPERELLEKALQMFAQSALELEDCYNIVYSKKDAEIVFATFDKKILSFLKKR